MLSDCGAHGTAEMHGFTPLGISPETASQVSAGGAHTTVVVRETHEQAKARVKKFCCRFKDMQSVAATMLESSSSDSEDTQEACQTAGWFRGQPSTIADDSSSDSEDD